MDPNYEPDPPDLDPEEPHDLREHMERAVPPAKRARQAEPPAWERKPVTHEWAYANSGDWCLLWLGCGVGWQAGSWLGRCYPLSRPIQPSKREESKR